MNIMKLPDFLTKVTTFSKVSAAILFIVLPFVGFYLGMGYEKSSFIKTEVRNFEKKVAREPISLPNRNTPEQSFSASPPNGKESNCLTKLGVNPYIEKAYKNSFSSKKGLCSLDIPYTQTTGYTLEYPESWNVRVIGVAGENLVFNEKTLFQADGDLLVYQLPSKLGLKDADKEVVVWEMVEDPVVASEEVLDNKEIIYIGDKECLILTTSLNNKIIKRYFTILKLTEGKGNVLFIFRIEKEKSEFSKGATVEIIKISEEILESLDTY